VEKCDLQKKFLRASAQKKQKKKKKKKKKRKKKEKKTYGITIGRPPAGRPPAGRPAGLRPKAEAEEEKTAAAFTPVEDLGDFLPAQVRR